MQIVTTRFVNTLTQEPVTLEYLPVGEITGLKLPGVGAERGCAADASDIVFEPSAEAVLGYLLGLYLNIYVYYVLLNAKASEQSARMVSMKNATDSAEDLIKELKLEYNKLRQGNITKNCWRLPAGRRNDALACGDQVNVMNIGTVVQVVGPVVDVEFPDALPPIYNALTVITRSRISRSR